MNLWNKLYVLGTKLFCSYLCYRKLSFFFIQQSIPLQHKPETTLYFTCRKSFTPRIPVELTESPFSEASRSLIRFKTGLHQFQTEQNQFTVEWCERGNTLMHSQKAASQLCSRAEALLPKKQGMQSNQDFYSGFWDFASYSLILP